MYTIFVRNWYKYATKNGKRVIVPNPNARREKIGTSQTIEGARKQCEAWNSTHTPGPLSRKAEFTSNY